MPEAEDKMRGYRPSYFYRPDAQALTEEERLKDTNIQRYQALASEGHPLFEGEEEIVTAADLGVCSTAPASSAILA